MHIKRFINCIFFFLSFLFTFYQVKAQVSVQDSLALVALYNKVPALQSDTTWLNGNVSTWRGVSVNSINRTVNVLNLINVTINDSIPREICGLDSLRGLNLAGCQVKGNIPSCIIGMSSLESVYLHTNRLVGVEEGADFSQLTNLKYFSIGNNLFADMPDFMSISSPVLDWIEVSQNYFNFDDLIPLTTKSPLNNYLYAPQHEIGEPATYFIVNVGDTADFPDASLIATGTNNSYTWLALNAGDSTNVPPPVRFRNINTSVLRVEGAQLADYKLYGCNITNPNLPGLTLRTHALTMIVIDPLLPQTITYLGDTIAYCGDAPLQLAAIAGGGRPVSFVSLSTNVTINPDNTLNLLQRGTATIQAVTPPDSIYHGDTLLIHITVTSHEVLPPFFAMTYISPNKIGEDLSASVQYFPELTYQWTLPNGQTYDSSSLFISPFKKSDMGLYQLKVTEGTCVHSSQTLGINFNVHEDPIIYELITPNGDGDNETFYIANLDPAVHNEVSIFNVTHQIVYHEENYRNDWDGANLPIGTYYYLVKYGKEIYKGNLFIKR